jgi:hypothetical protein
MKLSSWSLTDLSRQRLVVRRIALRAEVDRRNFRAARQRCTAQLRRVLGTPLGLIGCFVAGVVVSSLDARLGTKATPSGVEQRRARLPALLRALALSALTHARWDGAQERATAAADSE